MSNKYPTAQLKELDARHHLHPFSNHKSLRAAGALADMGDFEAATHEAATSPLNDRPEPTDAQKAAGNYKVGRVRVSGMDVSMPAGTQGYAGAAAALVVRRAGGDGAHRRRLRAVEVRAARGDAAPELHRKGRAVIQTAVPAWTLRRKPADVIGVGA